MGCMCETGFFSSKIGNAVAPLTKSTRGRCDILNIFCLFLHIRIGTIVRENTKFNENIFNFGTTRVSGQ